MMAAGDAVAQTADTAPSAPTAPPAAPAIPPAAEAPAPATPPPTQQPVAAPAATPPPPAASTLPPVTVTQPVAPATASKPKQPSRPAAPAPAAAAPAAPPKPAKKAVAPPPDQAPSPPVTPNAAPGAVAGTAEHQPLFELPASSAADAPPGTLIVNPASYASDTNLLSREILSRSGATLADTLAREPGVAASTFAPGASRPVVRGLDAYRVRVEENGIGSHDASTLSEDHAVPLDPFAADRVEVIRGPQTLRFGGSAIGGVVSATNARVPDAIPRNGVAAETKGAITSVDRGEEGAFKVTAGAGNIAVHADAFRRRAEDYDTPRGRQANSFVDAEGFAVGGSYVGARGFAGIAFQRFESVYGVPGEDVFLDPVQERISSRGELRLGAAGISALRYWFAHSRYEHREIEADTGEAGSLFRNDETEARLEVETTRRSTALGDLQGYAGVQIGRRRIEGQSFEGDGLLDPAKTELAGVYVVEELRLSPRLRLQAGGRIEQVDVEGTAADLVRRDLDFTPVSGSLGLLYDLPAGIVLRVTGQHAERAPDAAELFSKGVHEATGTFEIGDPGLGIERANSVEIGLKRAAGALRFDAAAYHSRFDGFIFKQLTGRLCDDDIASCGAGAQLDEVLFSQRDARFTGAEIAVQYDVAPIWRGVWGIEGQYDFVRARFDAGGNVPRIPPHRLGGGLYYRDANWLARAGMMHAFDQDRTATNETPTDGYTLLSAEVSYTRRLGPDDRLAPEITIGVRGENLLDEDVRNHVSFRKDEVLQPGIGVRLFGSIKLD